MKRRFSMFVAVSAVCLLAAIGMGTLLVSCGGQGDAADDSAAAQQEATAEESAANESQEPAEPEVETPQDITYQHLSGEEVQQLLASDDSCVLVDVRQPLAFEYEHIDGAINVPQDQIASTAESTFPDKDQTIILYCDYGGVSKIAAEDMVDMGYTHIIEFDGLEDWPGETVKADL